MTHTFFANSWSRSVPASNLPSAVVKSNDLRTFKEAMKFEDWRKSMKEEILALEDNEKWTLEHLPPRKRALGSQWVYKTKFLSNEDADRLKSSLVVFRNHQKAGVDYDETFAPVAKMTTVRIFLAIAASKLGVSSNGCS
ncbi:uncharacterized protein LOC110699391 [Chenopodium quinoa]|uniref:uncharacterized protein LOC110699391 n=1 Tax=Chenopodium quinoa TaxID=63459 RepID=UPI000B784341|nr:uncharacterized protein LOC110699391 [Chenopodium quinoa]